MSVVVWNNIVKQKDSTGIDRCKWLNFILGGFEETWTGRKGMNKIRMGDSGTVHKIVTLGIKVVRFVCTGSSSLLKIDIPFVRISVLTDTFERM